MSVMVYPDFKVGDRVYSSALGWHGIVVGEVLEEYGTVRVTFDSYIVGDVVRGTLTIQHLIDCLRRVI